MYAPPLLLTVAALASSALASPTVTTADIAPRQDSKLRIMPLGDSITEITCWRFMVWDQLTDAGYADKVHYVGSQNSNPENCKSTSPTPDKHHEGHSGWQAVNIANQYIEKWMKNTPADIVMFMLGTNDVVAGHSTADIMAAYTKIVKTARATVPNVKIIVDSVLPLTFANSAIVSINNAIPGWAKDLNTTESPIFIADCNTGFPTSDLRDGVHPSLAGDKIMASRIGPILLDLVKESLSK